MVPSLIFSYEFFCCLSYPLLITIIIPLLHLNRSIPTLILLSKLYWLRILIFHPKVAHIGNWSRILLTFMGSVWFVKSLVDRDWNFLVQVRHYLDLPGQQLVRGRRRYRQGGSSKLDVKRGIKRNYIILPSSLGRFRGLWKVEKAFAQLVHDFRNFTIVYLVACS